MNSLIEATKQENQEMWITLIDIKKAFDTVDIRRLQLALKRIKIPKKLEVFLVNMFTNREVKVITKFGLSEGFCPECGIDQEEVISCYSGESISTPYYANYTNASIVQEQE